MGVLRQRIVRAVEIWSHRREADGGKDVRGGAVG